MFIIYITFKNKKEATYICKELLNKKLIRCANIIDNVTSIYQWDGNIEEANEVIAIIKCQEKLVDEAIETAKKLHSYECAAIMAIKVVKTTKEFNNFIN